MATFTTSCAEPWFSYIRSGVKTVEGRKNSETWKSIKKGDTIIFNDGKEEKFTAEVTGVNKYTGKDALKDYLEKEGLEQTLPGVKTIEEGMKVYVGCLGGMEKIIDVGILGIHVKPT